MYMVWFGLVWFNAISTNIGYFMPNPHYRYILDISDLVGLGWGLWHTKHFWLFYAKSCSHISIEY